MTPDPLGIFVADVSNPQTWNQYSYVLNNPLRFIDPKGLYCVDSNGDDLVDDNGDPIYVNHTDCQNDGNNWITVDGQGNQTDNITVSADGSSDLDTSSASNNSLLSCTINVSNKLTISNGINYISGGGLLKVGSWSRTGADILGGGNAVAGILSAGQTLFGNSASGKQLAQTGAGMLADPSMGLNSALRVGGGKGIPAALEAVTGSLSNSGHVLEPAMEISVLETGGALTDAAAEGATGIGLIKLAADAVLALGSYGYCAATH
jgi:hypothetical protein